MLNWVKYIAAAAVAGAVIAAVLYYPAETFFTFLVGWLFFIPVAFLVYMVYGLLVYRKDLKHRIVVKIKQTEAMRALARREAELKREKERILYEEFRDRVKR